MFYSRIDKPLILKKYDITQRQRKRAINSPSQKRFFSDFFSFFNFFFFFFVVVKPWCRKATFTNIIKTDNLHLQFTAVFTETSKSISFKSKLNTAWKLSAFGNIKSQQPLKSYQSFKNLNKIQKRLQQIHSFLKLITNWLHVAVMSYERKRSFSGMRRLRTWRWTSMLIKWLNVLAIMNIHHNHSVSYNKACKFFDL